MKKYKLTVKETEVNKYSVLCKYEKWILKTMLNTWYVKCYPNIQGGPIPNLIRESVRTPVTEVMTNF